MPQVCQHSMCHRVPQVCQHCVRYAIVCPKCVNTVSDVSPCSPGVSTLCQMYHHVPQVCQSRRNVSAVRSPVSSPVKKPSSFPSVRKEDIRLAVMIGIIFICFLLSFLPLMIVNVFDDDVSQILILSLPLLLLAPVSLSCFFSCVALCSFSCFLCSIYLSESYLLSVFSYAPAVPMLQSISKIKGRSDPMRP